MFGTRLIEQIKYPTLLKRNVISCTKMSKYLIIINVLSFAARIRYLLCVYRFLTHFLFSERSFMLTKLLQESGGTLMCLIMLLRAVSFNALLAVLKIDGVLYFRHCRFAPNCAIGY